MKFSVELPPDMEVVVEVSLGVFKTIKNTGDCVVKLVPGPDVK